METSAKSNPYLILAALMLGSTMGPIDASIVNVILPTITEYFGIPIAAAQWVPTIYLLTVGSLLLFYGRLGDILGYRRVYLTGLAGFVIVSGLCGLSPTIQWLVLFRAIQGLAAGMMMAVPSAIITATFPPTSRGKAFGINALSISAGLAIGPSLGGFITALLGWRFAFLINLPIGIAAYLWARRVVPELRGHPGEMDLLGAMTAFVSLLSFLLCVNRFQYEGVSYATGLALLVTVLAGVWFLRLERKVAQPLMDLGIFSSATFSLASISALLNFVSQYVMVFLTPFFLQRVLHCPPNQVGLIMTSFPLAVMAVAPLSGSLSDRVGTRLPACLGAGLCALALLLMGLLPPSAGPADIAWRMAIFGLGTGIFQSPNNSAAMGSVSRPYLGVASGVLATVRNVGMVLGITLGGAILYAFVPGHTLEEPNIGVLDATAFLAGLRVAYLAGAVSTAVAALTSSVRHSEAWG